MRARLNSLQNSSGNSRRTLDRSRPSAPPLAHASRHKIDPINWDWTAFARGPCRPLCPCFPYTTSGEISVSDQVRRTTVAPWSFRKPARKPVRRSGTRALRFVASVCIPTGKLQRKRRHVSARTSCKAILQDGDRCSTARHYRQAKYDSQNPFNITSRQTLRQPNRSKISQHAAPGHHEGVQSQLSPATRV